MNQRKARALRKSLGMTKNNLKEKDLVAVNPVEKVVYLRNKAGELIPTKTTRSQIINRNLYYYRKQKKLISRGYHNG